MWVTKLACNSTPCVSNRLLSRWPRLQPVTSFGRCRRLLACFSDPFLVFDGGFPWSTKLLYNLCLRGECVLFGGGGGGMPSLGMSHDCSGNGIGFSKTSSQPRRACPWGMSRYVLSGFPFVWGPLSSSEGGKSGAVSSEAVDHYSLSSIWRGTHGCLRVSLVLTGLSYTTDPSKSCESFGDDQQPPQAGKGLCQVCGFSKPDGFASTTLPEV